MLTLLSVCCVDLVLAGIWLGGGHIVAGFTLLGFFMPVQMLLIRKWFLSPILTTDQLTKKGGSLLAFSFPIQALHLPTSKVRDRLNNKALTKPLMQSRIIILNKTVYTGSQHRRLLFRENILANMVLTLKR